MKLWLCSLQEISVEGLLWLAGWKNNTEVPREQEPDCLQRTLHADLCFGLPRVSAIWATVALAQRQRAMVWTSLRSLHQASPTDQQISFKKMSSLGGAPILWDALLCRGQHDPNLGCSSCALVKKSRISSRHLSRNQIWLCRGGSRIWESSRHVSGVHWGSQKTNFRESTGRWKQCAAPATAVLSQIKFPWQWYFIWTDKIWMSVIHWQNKVKVWPVFSLFVPRPTKIKQFANVKETNTVLMRIQWAPEARPPWSPEKLIAPSALHRNANILHFPVRRQNGGWIGDWTRCATCEAKSQLPTGEKENHAL